MDFEDLHGQVGRDNARSKPIRICINNMKVEKAMGATMISLLLHTTILF